MFQDNFVPKDFFKKWIFVMTRIQDSLVVRQVSILTLLLIVVKNVEKTALHVGVLIPVTLVKINIILIKFVALAN
jgi:hypothetical protein